MDVSTEGWSFFAAGTPTPKGSARAFVVRGRAVVTQDNREKGRTWAGVVATAALEAGVRPIEGGVVVDLVFLLARPKGHRRTGRRAGELRDGVDPAPARKPDLDKLVRAVWDALTGVAYADDGQVVAGEARKEWAGYAGEERSGVLVRVRPDLRWTRATAPPPPRIPPVTVVPLG